METLLNVWLPPAVIIGVVVFVNSLTNKRIDDLRIQMMSDHKNLLEEVRGIGKKLDEHIANYYIHKVRKINKHK